MQKARVKHRKKPKQNSTKSKNSFANPIIISDFETDVVLEESCTFASAKDSISP
ncbi:MAG: hypothetical protein Q4F82_04020 [bacterium]|nr:hypothetical protein [bacterium]